MLSHFLLDTAAVASVPQPVRFGHVTFHSWRVCLGFFMRAELRPQRASCQWTKNGT
jgi:hypothetical protein